MQSFSNNIKKNSNKFNKINVIVFIQYPRNTRNRTFEFDVFIN